MNEKLIEAFFDAPHTVLKRRLKPFSLRHAFVLAAGDNELMGGSDPTIGDLYQAVEVCSRDSSYFFSDAKPGIIRRWWWELRCKKLDIVAEFLAFKEYVEDYMAAPSVWTDESKGGSKAAKCNWIISTIAGLMKQLGMSREEAWNMPPGQAMWMLVAAYESDPNVKIDIMSDEEIQAVALLAAMDDEPPLTTEQGESNGSDD